MQKFKLSGNILKSETSTLKIFTRKHTTPSKPKYFLVQIQGKEKKYISSLYGEHPEYQFEYKGKRYTLILSDTEAIVKRGGVYV
jgi:hypothetical protein